MEKRILLFFGLVMINVNLGAQNFQFDPDNKVFGYTPRAFTFMGEEELLISGEMQYYRVDPTEWVDRMLKMKGALISTVSTYLPWGIHEPKKGKFSYTGYKDVFRFNHLLDSLSLYSILKPSGYICNEFTGGGFPAWIWAEDTWPRTADPKFYGFLDQWLENIIPQLNPLQITEGGNMIAGQLENEYSKGNLSYLLHYRDKARSLGLSVPLLNNGGGDLGHPGTIATYDMYLKPVPESLVERDWGRSKKRDKRTKPRFSSEYESGWLNAEYSKMETQMGSLSGEWLKTIASGAYFKGDAGLNYYMFTGGTDLGMNASKKFPNSYFNVAPIGEYGQLNDSYYRYKELHAFIKSFEEVFLYGREQKDIPVTVPKSIILKKLVYGNQHIYFLMNATKEEQSFIFDPRESGYKGHRVTLAPLGSKFLPVGYPIGKDLNVVNTSSEVLWRQSGTLMLFGEQAREGTIRFKGNLKGQISANPFDMEISMVQEYTDIGFMHTHEDQFIEIAGTKIWVLSKKRAENTFFHQENRKPKGALVSDLYFAHIEKERNGLAIDYLARPKTNSDQTYIDFGNGKHYEFGLTSRQSSDMIRIPVTDLRSTPLTLDMMKDKSAMKSVKCGTPYEKAGLYKNGYAFYSGTIKLKGDNVDILLPEINDYFFVYFNGKLIHEGERTASITLTETRKGNNSLEIFTLAGGLDKNGPGATMSLSGMNMPIYVNPSESIRVNKWKRKTLFRDSKEKGVFYRDKDVLLSYRDPVYSAKIDMDIVAISNDEEGTWKEVDFGQKESLQKFDGNVDWTKMSEMIDKTSIYIDNAYAGKKVLMKINDADVWYSLYVNGQHFQGGWQGWDRWGFEDRPRFVDVTSAIKFGQDNQLIVRCWQGPKGGGLQEAVELIFCDDVLDDKVKLFDVNKAIERTLAQNPKKGELSDQAYTTDIPAIASGIFEYTQRANVQAPLYLELLGCKVVSCVYLNGELLAKYSPSGYSDKLRLLPSMLKNGENTISIVGFFEKGELPKAMVKSYFLKEKGKHHLKFE